MSKKQILNENNKRTSNLKPSLSKVFLGLATNQKQKKSSNDYGKVTVEALRRETKNK